MGNDKTLNLEQIKRMSTDEILNLYRQGYSLADTPHCGQGCAGCNDQNMNVQETVLKMDCPPGVSCVPCNQSNQTNQLQFSERQYIQPLAPNCGSFVQNSNRTITVTATGGTPPYTLFELLRANGADATTGFVGIDSYVPSGSQTSYAFTHQLTETPGTYTFRGQITDSCLPSNGGPKVVYNDCNLTVSAAPCPTPSATISIA